MNKDLLKKTGATLGTKWTKEVFAFLVLLGFLSFNTTSAQSVAYNYNYSESAGNTYTPIVPSGTSTTVATGVFTTTTTGLYVPYVLPFTFHYNGAPYTTVNVSDNGFLLMGNTNIPAGVPGNTPLSTATAYSGAIAGFGNNLVGAIASAEVLCDVIGTAPNRTFVLQYKNVQRKPAVGVAFDGVMNFQIRLSETTNLIEIIFQNALASSSATLFTGQFGLRGAAATDYVGRRNNINPIWTNGTGTGPTAANTQGLGTQGTAGTFVMQQGPLAGTRLVWTPCFAPTGLTAVLQGDNSTLDLNWTNPSVIPPGGFDWEIRTGPLAPGSGGALATGNTSSNTVSVPGLQIGVTYYVYIKPNCKTAWIPNTLVGNVPTTTVPSSIAITPTCAILTIPYTQNFESAVVPALPICNTRLVNGGVGALMVTVDRSVTPFYGFTSKNITTQGALAQDTWYFTQGISITPADMVASGGNFRLSYVYGGSREQSFFEQKMKVFFGTAPSVVGMTTLLADHNSIKLSPINGVINFTVAAAGTYYLGFNGYAIASQGTLQLDDINLDISSCKPPTSLVAGQITSNSAVIAWTPPSSSPSAGYQYYVSTVNTAPNASTPPSGSTAVGNTLTTLTGLLSSTTYYFWVRSNCGSGETSIWSSSGTFTTLVPYVVACVPSGLGAQDPNGITNVTMGSINNTTGIEVNNYGDYSAFTTNVAQGATVPVAITYRTGFTYLTAIWIDWNNDGDFVDAGELGTPAGLVSTNAVPSVLNTSFTVPALQPLGPYRIRIGGIDDPSFAGGALTPCRTGAYQAFEDYSIFVITAPPALTLSDGTAGSTSNTICSGGDTSGAPVNVTSVQSAFQVYNWTPSTGVSGTLSGGFVFNPTTTTTYILTASQTSGNFSSNSASYTVFVNPNPTTITITPPAVTTCQTATTGQALVASGGVVSGVDIMVENFNGATNTFTTVNNSSPAAVTTTNNPADAAWTLRNSPYLYNGFTNFTSNDVSQFYLSNSDDQGSGGLTNTLLISPVFSLAAPITNASLSFWHIYRGWSSGAARVEISIDNGATYTLIPTLSWTTNSVGTTDNWVNVTVNLAAYLGNATCRIRFNYKDAQFGWFWGIDNVRVSGSATSDITWSPTTGLWNDAALTSPYIGTATSTVYARPNTTTTYTAGADDPFTGCGTATNVLVTVTPFTGGTASTNQTICYGAPTALTLAGQTTPSTVQWQVSTDNITFGNIAGATSTTLTPVQMGALTATRYYRAVVTGVCVANSNVVTITLARAIWNAGAWSNFVGPDATMIAQFNSNYTSTGNLNACSVLVTAGTVTFASNHTLTVQNDVRVTGGSLVFNNNSSLVQVNTLSNLGATIANTGNITYRRDSTPMLKFDYTYWSSPVAGQTLTAFSPNTNPIKFFTFDGSVNNWVYVPGATAMSAGKGYIVRAPDIAPFNTVTRNVFNGVFTGVPNTGTLTTPIFGATNQFNLIGNPYASAIYASDLMDDPLNVGVMDATLYLWTHNTPIAGNNYIENDYAIYNYMGGVGTRAALTAGNTNVPNGKIASGQSFLVKGIANGVVTFKNDMRVPAGANNNDQFFRAVNPSPTAVQHAANRIWLEVTNTQGAYKQTMVGYAENATNEIDRGYDSPFVDIGNATLLYSHVNGDKFSIQGKPMPFLDTDIVPLGFKSTVVDSFTITLSDFDDLFTAQNIYLEDTFLNVIHDLKASNYTFVSEIGTFDTRFILRYTDSALGIDTPAFNQNSVIVYKNGQGLHINSGAMHMQDVVIYDIAGRLLASQKDINQTTTSFTTLPTTEQVLLVKITGENGAVVTKKVVY